MKAVTSSVLFAGIVAAHSAVWSINLDTNEYPARDARFDSVLGAKRIEWSFDDAQGFTWAAVTNVSDPGIACGVNAKPPALHAKVRAGATVNVQWSGIIKMHLGPVMSYLGAWDKQSNQSPNQVDFFKIEGLGYDVEKKMWANEKLIAQNYSDTFQIPSDIKPGTYILRTELLALHGNVFTDGSVEPYGGRGPQFYTHCFNLDISGEGTVKPEGVRFPGSGYKQADPGVSFELYNQKKFPWVTYPVPGPPKYAGKYDAPSGPAPVVPAKERGEFPPEFQAKYAALKTRWDTFALASAKQQNMFAKGPKEGDAPRDAMSMPKIPGADPGKPFDLTAAIDKVFGGLQKSNDLGAFYKQHLEEGKLMPIEIEKLREEGRKLGIVS